MADPMQRSLYLFMVTRGIERAYRAAERIKHYYPGIALGVDFKVPSDLPNPTNGCDLGEAAGEGPAAVVVFSHVLNEAGSHQSLQMSLAETFTGMEESFLHMVRPFYEDSDDELDEGAT